MWIGYTIDWLIDSSRDFSVTESFWTSTFTRKENHEYNSGRQLGAIYEDQLKISEYIPKLLFPLVFYRILE